MLFNSLAFAIFLPIVFAVYWAVPHKFRWVLLLAASYYFYMSWNPKYIFLILLTTVVSYAAALLLERENDKKKRKWILAIAALICLGVLFFFKYFNFFSQSVVDFLRLFSLQLSPLTLKLILPVGISFYTFQTLSYIIDVYKGQAEAEHHFGYYAAFISFFPQLVAGPIERTRNLLPQMKAEQTFDYDQAAYGLKLMAWGYYKKIVIADTLALYVSKVYDNPQEFQGFALILATLLFSIQIYCDFSGYSDIAIGTAKLFGIRLMTNFHSPYFSQSLKEFWSRWHISLSTWFRDYVYIPLGGSRTGKPQHYVNLILTFLVSGLWHGADWTFVIWGGIHGIAQVAEDFLIPKRYMKSKGIVWLVRVVAVFAFCSFAWLFFVSDSLSDAVYVLSHMFDHNSHLITYLHDGFSDIGMRKQDLALCVFCILPLAAYDFISLKKDCIAFISKQNTFVRYTVYLLLLCLIMFLRAGVQAEFVYFQF